MRRSMILALVFCLLVVACSSTDSREAGTAAALQTPQAAATSPTAPPSAPPLEATAPAQPQTQTPAASVVVIETATSTDAAVKLPDLPPGWTKFDGGGAAMCSRGTPYSFWVRPGTVNKLLIFFEGGGGCWDAESCREGSTFFDDSVDDGDSPSHQSGVFDLDHPENPFKDYYMVFVPYCTGDVHMGNEVYTYPSDSGADVTIHHKGFVNGSTVMQWIYQHFAAPESIFVTGCSAGSVGSIMFAPYIINQYPAAAVYQLGDSEAFVFGRPVDLQEGWRAHDNFAAWIPALRAIEPGQWTAEEFYTAIANFYPQHRFSQYNTAHDAVQIRFYRASVEADKSWEEALDASLSQIQAQAPNFRSYLAGGSSHCIMPFPTFYTREVGGARFRDWVDAIANGRDVPNVRCTNCDSEE